MNKIQVTIQGSDYTIITEKSNEETAKIVSDINKNINDCKNKNAKLTTLNATILALMNLAENHENLKSEFKDYKTKNDPLINDYTNLKSDCEKLYKNLVVKDSELKRTNKKLEEVEQNLSNEINSLKEKSKKNLEESNAKYENELKNLHDKYDNEISITDDLKKQLDSQKQENDLMSKEYNKLKDEYNKLAYQKNKIENLLMDYQREAKN